MPAIYRQRHPERTVLYRVLATYFDAFLAQYETPPAAAQEELY